MSQENKDKIVSLYNQGFGGITIGRMLNLHPGTIYYYLKDVKKPNNGRQAKTDKEEIRRLYEEEKLSCQQIADKLGLSKSSVVYVRLKNMGVKLRSKSEGMRARGIVKIGSDEDVINKYKSGLSQKEVAATYNLFSGDTIKTVLDKYGINESNRGARNPSWKGGINPLSKTIRSSTKSEEFRNTILLEENYTSQVSDIRGGELNLHHIVPFNSLLTMLDKDKPLESRVLWYRHNVIVLTEEEHKKIHRHEKLNFNIKQKFSIQIIERSYAELLLQEFHYIGTAPKNTHTYLGLFIGKSLVGVCLFGYGTNKYMSSKMGGKTLELTRFCLVDWLPKNSGSYFISQSINYIKQHNPDIKYLVSFADTGVGHLGGLYKACNWKFEYQCHEDYKYQLQDGRLVHKSKFRCKNGKTERQLVEEAGAIKIKQPGKMKYSYKI